MATSKLYKQYAADPSAAYNERPICRRKDGGVEYIYKYDFPSGISYDFRVIGVNQHGVIYCGSVQKCHANRFFYQFAHTWDKKMWADMQGKSDDEVREILYDKHEWYMKNYK